MLRCVQLIEQGQDGGRVGGLLEPFLLNSWATAILGSDSLLGQAAEFCEVGHRAPMFPPSLASPINGEPVCRVKSGSVPS